jgi:hypothetical protein
LSDPTDLSARTAIFNAALTPSVWAQSVDKATGFYTVVIAFNDWNGEASDEYRWEGNTPTGIA